MKSRTRSEEHTSELQSHDNLVCRLLLEKKRYNLGEARKLAGRPARDGSEGEDRDPLWIRAVMSAGPFFFNDTATTEIYTLSLHDALPICARGDWTLRTFRPDWLHALARSEEHTSGLQSHDNIVCRLLLEKKTHSGSSNPPPHLPPQLQHRHSYPPSP